MNKVPVPPTLVGVGLAGLLLASIFLAGCDTADIGDVAEESENDENIDLSFSKSAPNSAASMSRSDVDLNRNLEKLAKSMARSLENPDMRRLVKGEVEKKFNGAPEVLYKQLMDRPVGGGPNFRQRLSQGYAEASNVGGTAASDAVDNAVSRIPRLHVAVPVGADEWDADAYTPLVAYVPQGIDDNAVERIKAFDAEGNVHWLDGQTDPDRPVVVLGINERTDDEGNLIGGFYTPVRVNGQLILPLDPGGSTDAIDCGGGCTGGGGGSGGGGGTTATKRVSPHAEKLYRVKVPDDREPWFREPAEIRVQMNGVKSPSVDAHRGRIGDPGKNWKTLDRFLFYWNPKTLGDFIAVKWWEEDGGPTVEWSRKIGGTVNGISFEETFKFTWKNDDDDMGAQAVNFTDPLSTVYNTGWVSWQHK